MKFRLGSLWLAAGGVESAAQVSVNGTQVNDAVTFYAAAFATMYARGGRANTLTFSATRRFDTLREAHRFTLEHFSALPQQDDLYVWLGTDADGEWAVLSGAVIDQCTPAPNGTSVVVQYSFRFGAVTTDSPPPSAAEPTEEMVKRSTTAIASGADQVDVVFSTPFAGPGIPIVTVTMQSPAGGDALWSWVIDGTVTVSGFSAKLSAPTPAAGYKLSWTATA